MAGLERLNSKIIGGLKGGGRKGSHRNQHHHHNHASKHDEGYCHGTKSALPLPADLSEVADRLINSKVFYFQQRR